MRLEGEALAVALEVITANHYTRSIPSGKRACYAFENCLILFALPANKNISRYLIDEDNQVWELARLWAPDGHRANLLTEALAVATAAFRQDFPAVQALVSYADPNVGHRGGIYRAASWIYKGQCEETRAYRSVDGQIVSRRAFHSGKRSLLKAEIEALGYVQLSLPGKHRFAKGLTKKARRKLAPVGARKPASRNSG